MPARRVLIVDDDPRIARMLRRVATKLGSRVLDTATRLGTELGLDMSKPLAKPIDIDAVRSWLAVPQSQPVFPVQLPLRDAAIGEAGLR